LVRSHSGWANLWVQVSKYRRLAKERLDVLHGFGKASRIAVLWGTSHATSRILNAFHTQFDRADVVDEEQQNRQGVQQTTPLLK
jgi:hypothetical protein